MVGHAKYIVALAAERDRLVTELAAANDSLDRLREAIRRQHTELFYVTAAQELRVGCDAKPPETTSIRDIAAAHGFDPMPADIAQRSVDGETNYLRLNPEDVG